MIRNTDFYEEISVPAKPKKGVLAMIIISATVAVVALVLGLVFQFPQLWLLTVVGVVLFISQMRNRRVDYDYCFLPEEIEIAKIINRVRRRTAIQFDYSNIRFIAPKDSLRLQNERERFPDMRFTDYTSTEPANPVYGFCLDLKGISTIILLEPTEEMMDHVKKAIPDKIYKD